MQDGTPTPAAPVEIRSVEGAAAVVAGKNLYISSSVTSSPNTAKSITDSGFRVYTTANSAFSGAAVNRYSKTFIDGERYTISADASVTSGHARITVRKTTGGSIVDGSSTLTTSGHLSLTFTYSSEMQLYIFCFCTLSTSEAGDVTFSNFQIEAASTESAYETPHGVSKTPLLPSTAEPLRSLPDGTHDELTVARDGSVTVVRRVGSVVFDGSSDENWSVGSGRAFGSTTSVTDIKRSTSASVAANVRCSACGGVPSGIDAANTIYSNVGVAVSSSASTIFLNLTGSTATTTAALKSTLAATPVELVYPLATPTTETLPSVTMPTVPSTNLTAWVDATDGDGAAMAAGWTVDYERSLQIVIDNIETAIADI